MTDFFNAFGTSSTPRMMMFTASSVTVTYLLCISWCSLVFKEPQSRVLLWWKHLTF